MKNFNWITGLFIIIYHALLAILLPIYLYIRIPSTGLVISTLVLAFICGLSITTTYHRSYSHGAYKLNKAVQATLLFFATLATQGSAIRWSHDHRIHHRYVDTDKDPYSIKKGFWYAHIGWLFEKGQPIDKELVADLTKNKMLVWQDKYYGLLLTIANTITFITFGIIFNDYLGSFVFGFLLRTFIVQHVTWFINSLAHTLGTQNFSTEMSAVDNYFIAFFTWGEGYHNYHHTFSSDYRNGIKWYHFDPTKWLVWSLSKIGLATNLIKINQYTISKKMVHENKRFLIDRIRQSMTANKEALEAKVNEYSERLNNNLETIKKMKQSLKQRHNLQKEKIVHLKLEMKQKMKSLKRDWKTWCKLVKAAKHNDSGFYVLDSQKI